MSEPRPNRRKGPPHNPGLRDLIANKRKWSSPPKKEYAIKGFCGWFERGYLPHRDEPNLTQFVTFRLVDSFPEALRSEWEHLFEIEREPELRKQLEVYLDKGNGDCHLRIANLAQLTEDAFRHFHGEKYELKAWVIMPNHVHVLFHVRDVPMSEIVKGWKKYTAKECNQILGAKGLFWAPDYWDTFMRDDEHERKTVRYIENNPTKARLVREPRGWRWSSARLRDENGRLWL